MKTYKVELVNRDRLVLEVAEDRHILDAVEAIGRKLPVGCRYGACITCAARLITGKVRHSRPTALKPSWEAFGYVLLCIAAPISDCQLEVGVECQGDLYINPFKIGNH